MEEKNKAWQTVSSKYLFRRPWLTVRCEDMLLPNGNHIPEYYILEYPDWVNMIAITKEGKFVFVRQYRPGVQTCALPISPYRPFFAPVCARRKMFRHWYPPSANCGKKQGMAMGTGRNIW